MGMIVNIDEALKLRSDYNVLQEPLKKMMEDQYEAWERENPIDLLFKRGTLASFQETYTSSIGFDHAFSEVSDYSVGPIFNTAEGFSATYTSKEFRGRFIVSKLALEERKYGSIKDEADAFVRRWTGDLVEYCMKSIEGGFGKPGKAAEKVEWTPTTTGATSRLWLNSADTEDGDITNVNKVSLFNKAHTTVKRKDGDEVIKQANMYRACDNVASPTDTSSIQIDGSDPLYIAKLADLINVVITEMENYRDDNGKRAGVLGAKAIVAPNEPHLKAALQAALSLQEINGMPNTAFQRATLDTTPYLNDIGPCKDGAGFFIVDRGYNAANHGLEFTERVPMTMSVYETKDPDGVTHSARQRMDTNCATWRGIAYVRVKNTVASNPKAYEDKANFETIKPLAVAKPVSVVGTVNTKQST